MSNSVTPEFGEIFRYNEYFYVYLAQNELFVYAAKILNPEMTLSLKNIDDRKAKLPTASKSDGHKAYAYVLLTTEQFINRAAHLGSPAEDADKILNFDWIGCVINKNDKDALKIEILREGSPVEKGLKKIFQNMAS